MTTIVIRKTKNGSYQGFTCMGHAGFAKKNEKDVLCAAISTLTICTVNALEALAGETVESVSDEETGFLKCDFQGELQEKSVFLMDAMVYSLESLSIEYGKKYLQIKFEEV